MPYVNLIHAKCEFPDWSTEQDSKPMTGTIWNCKTQGCKKIWMLTVDQFSACWHQVIPVDSFVATGVVEEVYAAQFVDYDPELIAEKEREKKCRNQETLQSYLRGQEIRQRDQLLEPLVLSAPSPNLSKLLIWKQRLLSLIPL